MVKGERILVIEEDRQIAAEIALTLEAAGFETAAAGTAVQGLSKLYAGRPDLVIVAYDLRFASGERLCLRLLQVCTIPVIVIGVEGETAATLLETGADACMARPVQFSELVARVRSLLRRRKPPEHDPSIHDVTPESRRRSG
jgi:DNA-binding response OmpR family regulator